MSEEKFKSNQHEEVMKELREMGSSLADLGLQKFDDVSEDFWICLLYTSPSPRD